MVSVTNAQGGVVAQVAKIQCEGRNACAGATFTVGYWVSVGALECGPEACYGCTIDVAGTVYDCDPTQVAVPAPATTAAPVRPVTTAAPVRPVTTAAAVVTTAAPVVPISLS